jgi:endonuclease/exonuclease/phosphatase family metal-dependent hydrolase
MNRLLRVATYNIHKCRGLDRRIRVDRIVDVIEQLDADVVALQEVMSVAGGKAEDDQVRYIASRMAGYNWCFGENRIHGGGPYGNAILTRLPITYHSNYDLTWRKRERRGCLRADIRVRENCVLHAFNVHLGTGYIERRHQARRLVSPHVLHGEDLRGPRVVVGDFNEWTRGLASRLMSENFDSVDLRLFSRLRRTYPGVLPVLHLDHFYFDNRLKLEGFKVHRSRKALVASDHLPLVADFRV